MNADYRDMIRECLAKASEIVGQEISLYRYKTEKKAYVKLPIDSTPAEDFYPDTAAANKPFSLGFLSAGLQSPHILHSFSIYQFPGCCALCISSGATTSWAYSNKGLNKLGIKIRIAIAGLTGYTAIMCTDIAHNSNSIKTIEGAGGKKLDDLVNRRTKNRVNIYIIRVP